MRALKRRSRSRTLRRERDRYCLGDRKDLLEVVCRARNDVHADEFTDAACGTAATVVRAEPFDAMELDLTLLWEIP